MTEAKLDEVIKRYTDNAEYVRQHGDLEGCMEFRELAEFLTECKKLFITCKDAVSRADVLGYLTRSYHSGMGKKKSYEYNSKFVSMMPSVQPCEITDEQAIEHLQKSGWMQMHDKALSKPYLCENAVSREAVIKAMYDLCDTGETLKENPWRDNPHIDAIIDTIENLPPVTPARPKGKWIFEDGACPVYRCSNCHKFIPVKMKEDKFEDLSRLDAYIICPRCGADMKGCEVND